jgi:hypothetical protein
VWDDIRRFHILSLTGCTVYSTQIQVIERLF